MKRKRAPEQNHKWTYYIDNKISRESANNLRASYIRTLVGAHTRARMWTITLYNKAMEERASRSSVVFHKIGCENRRPSQYCRVSENDQKAHRSTDLKVFLVLKKEGKHSTTSRVFLYTCFVLYRFLRALQQNSGAVEASLFVKYTADKLLKCSSCLKRWNPIYFEHLFSDGFCVAENP